MHHLQSMWLNCSTETCTQQCLSRVGNVFVCRNIQRCQASESSKCATCNWFNLVAVQVPARDICSKSRRLWGPCIACTKKSGVQVLKRHQLKSMWSGCSLGSYRIKISITSVTKQRIVTYNSRMLSSPVNALLAINVIWLLLRLLREHTLSFMRRRDNVL